MSVIGVPLVSWGTLATLWNILAALWEARGLIAAIGFALWFWFWLCRRHRWWPSSFSGS
jgi:hypothetical protein